MFHVKQNGNICVVILLTVLFCVTPTIPLAAAPFCIEGKNINRMCNFFDPAQCIQQAETYNGVCTVDNEQLVSIMGTERFCIVNAALRAYCVYADRMPCDREARKNNDLCIGQTLLDPTDTLHQYDIENAP